MLILPKKRKLILPRKPQGGYFIICDKDGNEKQYIKNSWLRYGATTALQLLFQRTNNFAATWYMGLTSVAGSFDTSTLATLAAGEPAGNGYARQAIANSNVGWPTIQEVNGVIQALSLLCTFTASANWSSTWQYSFLCDAAAGTAGNVIAISGPAASPVSTLNGAGPNMKYTFFLRG